MEDMQSLILCFFPDYCTAEQKAALKAKAAPIEAQAPVEA